MNYKDLPQPDTTDEDFNRSASLWFYAAVIFAALTLVVVFGASAVVLSQNGYVVRQQSAQAFAPFLLALMAGVTFCGAVWRGKLTSEQLRQQTRQNNANDTANYAKLLQDGAKLLTDLEKAPGQIAGVASLSAVIADPERRFSQEAMDVLANYFLTHFPRGATQEVVAAHKELPVVAACGSALTRGADNGRRSTTRAVFEAKSKDFPIWPRVYGFKESIYFFGQITPDNDILLTKSGKGSSFHGTKIRKVVVTATEKDGATRFADCEFTSCKIIAIDKDTLIRNDFIRCDFSNCDFQGIEMGDFESIALTGGRNYYRIGEAPRHPQFSSWKDILQEAQPEDGFAVAE